MANIRLIRRQIRGVQNIAKITRAMEMIATSKMRRAQEAGLAGRPYAELITRVLSHLAALEETGREHHPLLERRPVKRVAILHITPDRGLCGGLHSSLNRNLASFILEQKLPTSLIVVGRKGIDFARRNHLDIHAEFTHMSDRASLLDTLPISRIIMEDYVGGHCDQVFLAYAQFVSTTVQRPVMQQILPIEPAMPEAGVSPDYIYEPGPTAVLSALLPRFVEMLVYHAVLEAIASEQSARVVAMRNATDNANELIQSLTLTYNKVRQESITTELLDIAGGAAALG
ncbi:MAG: ATP synthase F1 subunit gamma [Dehalococcoidia bacterium]|jgi:F-type H+-transporting ATPase subunit gamma|nr:MAG: ATP synthase F1 subunit gamma [Dehalococcoidia bacterium]